MSINIYRSRKVLKYLFVLFTFVCVAVSIWLTQVLVEKLSEEERERMELWADATRELARTDNMDADLSFVQKVIESNHSIPVLLADADGNVIYARNVELQGRSRVSEFAFAYAPIEVKIDSESQFIYYDDSMLLKQLHFFPYVQVGIVVVFLLVVVLALYVIQRAEQDRVWVGLSRETAHQLGTPISSLLAWVELLKLRYPTDGSFDEMKKDVSRLNVIADRFSKIGSKPELKCINVGELVQQNIAYMSARVSNKVRIESQGLEGDNRAKVNVDLLSWVFENLFKNAIDAMEGEGTITVQLTSTDKHIEIDVSDTGKGIARANKKAIFTPGFTTKQRGWGLGLSLAKRIVEEYHKGKIFVKHTELGKGTTFRVMLRK